MQSKALMGNLRSRNISQVIIDRIIDGIMSGELRPGERLPPEDEFASRIGVGKSSVREAMKILEAFGVVEIRRADGTYIVDEFKGAMLSPIIAGVLMAQHDASELIAFVAGVEEMAIHELVGSCDHKDVEACRQLLAQGKLAEAGECLSAELSNPLVRELYRKTLQLASYELQLLWQESQDSGKCEELLASCDRCLMAIEQGDESLACEAMRQTEKVLLSLVR